MNNREEWYDINNFSNYRVSNLGRVVEINENKILKPYMQNGHYFVTLIEGEICKTFKVAVLVFKYVLDIKISTYYVMYKDNNPMNCSVENIYLIHGSHRSRKKLSSDIVEQIYNSILSDIKVKDIAKAFNVTEATVYGIKNKKNYTDITNYIDLVQKVKDGKPTTLKFLK